VATIVGHFNTCLFEVFRVLSFFCTPSEPFLRGS
jgi:hypothetical protein